MGKRTTTNAGRTISTQGTEDWACAVCPDICFSANAKTFKPYNNKVCSKLLKNGTAITTIAGEKIWTKEGQLGPPSDPQQDQVRGQFSGKPAMAEAVVVFGSTTVFAEGSPVVRVDDWTFQNSKNTFGIVKPFPFELDLGDGTATDDAAGTGADKAKAKPTKPPERTGKKPPDPGFPQSGKDHVDECWVTGMVAFCSDGRAPKCVAAEDFYLEVCNWKTLRDKVKMRAGVNGICGKAHPVWTVGPQTATGLELVFEVPSVPSTPLTGVELLKDRPYKDHEIRCNGCKPGPHRLTVRAYEALSYRKDYDLKSMCPDFVTMRLAVLNEALKIISGEEEGRAELGKGNIRVEAQVKEHTDHRVFVWYKVKLDVDPLFAIAGDIPLGVKGKGKGNPGFLRGGIITRINKLLLERLGTVAEYAKKLSDLLNPLDYAGKLVRGIGSLFESTGQRTGSETLEKIGAFLQRFKPEALLEKVEAGAYLKVSCDVKLKGEVERAAPDAVNVGNGVGLSGGNYFEIGLKAEVKDNLFSFTINGNGTQTFSGGVSVDEVGVHLDDVKSQIDSFAVQCHLKAAGGQFIMCPDLAGFDWQKFETPDTFDLLKTFPRLKQLLCQRYVRGYYLYRFGKGG